jgi:hypothetical protein
MRIERSFRDIRENSWKIAMIRQDSEKVDENSQNFLTFLNNFPSSPHNNSREFTFRIAIAFFLRTFPFASTSYLSSFPSISLRVPSNSSRDTSQFSQPVVKSVNESMNEYDRGISQISSFSLARFFLHRVRLNE